jgi:hypothetical protein
MNPLLPQLQVILPRDLPGESFDAKKFWSKKAAARTGPPLQIFPQMPPTAFASA